MRTKQAPPFDSPGMIDSHRSRLLGGLQRVAFFLISGAIVGISSERIFWYWESDPVDHWVTAVFYGLATAAVLWVIDKYRVNSLSSLMLVAPIFAYMVEGVITPILYSGGPFVPFFPAWFTFWHGFMSLVGLWYLLHLWLVQGRTGTIALASTGMGLFWGLWSVTMLLPENVDDQDLIQAEGGPLDLLTPPAFARYTISFTLILAAMHWLWGSAVKPMAFEPTKWAKRVYVLAVGAILVAWTVAIPWALPMFAAYTAAQIWILRRHALGATGPGLFQQLAGRVRVRHLLALTPMPVVAALSYGLIWELQLPMGLIRGFMFTVIFIQFGLGGFLMIKLARRTLRAAARPLKNNPKPVELSNPPPPPLPAEGSHPSA